MINKQILKKAIEKAVKNGWKPRGNFYNGDKQKAIDFMVNDHDAPFYKEFLFDHDFAKAFFGEAQYGTADIPQSHLSPPEWKTHLQQMVLEKDKIKYLEKFL